MRKLPLLFRCKTDRLFPHEIKTDCSVPDGWVEPRGYERLLKVPQQSRANRVRTPRTAPNQYLVFTTDIRDGREYLFGIRSIEDATYTRRDPNWAPPMNEATKRKERRDNGNNGTQGCKDWCQIEHCAWNLSIRIVTR